MASRVEGRALREALLYERVKGDRVKCGLCERRCVIPPGETGYCGTRKNLDGKLYTLVYGVFTAGESRPISPLAASQWPSSTSTHSA